MKSGERRAQKGSGRLVRSGAALAALSRGRADETSAPLGYWRFALIVLLIAAPIVASACPVCYGTQQTPLTKSAGNGILFLLGIVGSVQVGFVALFVSFWRRTKALQQNVGAGSQPAQLQIIEGGKER